MDPVPIVYSYSPVVAPTPDAAAVGGGALITVSPRAAAAIRSRRHPDTGLLEPAAHRLLAELEDREAHATELGLLVRALARREVYVWDGWASR